MTPKVAAFLLLVATWAAGAGACADELVQIAPHRAAGPGESVDTPPLLGYLARPDRPGRLAAVVVLHWCLGYGTHDIAAAAMLKSWGYVALAPDSLDAANLCARGSGIVAEAIDAYAALRFLAAQDYVDADRIAVVGYSMGGGAVLTAIEQGQLERDQPQHFSAAIAYYPTCVVSNGVMTAPLLILIGERDDWTPAEACRKMVAHESDISISRPPVDGVPVKLVVYPNSTHAFDLRGPPQHYLGHYMERDADATKDAEAQMRAFLQVTLGEPSASPR